MTIIDDLLPLRSGSIRLDEVVTNRLANRAVANSELNFYRIMQSLKAV